MSTSEAVGDFASGRTRGDPLRICLVYDHLFPQTVGGGERWMRDLALALAAAGHDVTYLTMRHWDAAEVPHLEGVRVLGLTPAGRVYGAERRTLLPPLRFGLAVARHLWAHGREFDVVHMPAFPYFPLLAAGANRRRGRYDLAVCWFEFWTKPYWRRYAGTVIGTAGWFVQNACVRIRQTAFCISRLHAARLIEAGLGSHPEILPGLYTGAIDPTPAERVDPDLVVYAGRHVPEKRIDALVRAFALAHERRPALRLVLYGDGPERPRLEALVRDLGVEPTVTLRGRRPEEEVAAAIAQAACLATASEREGYGLVVVEAAAHGTPSVVVAGPENAATELVVDGVNGVLSPDASPERLADALLRVVETGRPLRDSTIKWFADNARTLGIEASLELVLRAFQQARSGRRGQPLPSPAGPA